VECRLSFAQPAPIPSFTVADPGAFVPLPTFSFVAVHRSRARTRRRSGLPSPISTTKAAPCLP